MEAAGWDESFDGSSPNEKQTESFHLLGLGWDQEQLIAIFRCQGYSEGSGSVLSPSARLVNTVRFSSWVGSPAEHTFGDT